MEYQELAVPASLAAHVQCVWRLRAGAGGGIETIYPDGRCEVIVHLGAAPRCWDAARGWHEQAPTLFAAQRVTAVRLAPTGPIDCVGVRLMPAASAMLVPRGLARLRDRIVDLTSIDRALSAALRAAVRAFAHGNDGALWRLLTHECTRFPIDARIAAASAWLEASRGRARIGSMARAAAMSVRALQMKFRAQVGLSPKELARVLRLQATLRALDGNDTPLAELASAAGFADQAHVTREVKRATGLTPARLRAALRADRDGDAAVRLAAAFVRGYAR